MFGLFVGLVVGTNYALTRTKWGRWVTAVGGNREAARRAGINVSLIYTSAFMLCSTLAALGGILSAVRLASASQQAGTGDVNLDAIAAAVIGGTSLFGGRGSAYSALLGIIVIQSIASGLTLARSFLGAAIHDHGWRAGDRRHRRCAGTPIPRVPRASVKPRCFTAEALFCERAHFYKDDIKVKIERGGVLAGKVAAVTGAASGIGLAVRQSAFLAEGARVVLIDMAEERLRALCDRTRSRRPCRWSST